MRYLVDYIYGMFVTPSRTSALIAARKPIGTAALVLLVISLISGLAAFMEKSKETAAIPGGAIPALLILVLILAFVGWFLRSAILHFLAQLMGGVGSPKSLLCIVAFVELPAILMAPAILISRFAGNWFFIVAELAIAIWSIVLTVIGVKANYALSTGKSVLVVLLPGIVAVAVVIVFVLLVFIAMVPFMGDIMRSMPTGGMY